MQIPKYWAKSEKRVAAPDGHRYALARWQWSNESARDAQEHADARIEELANKVMSGAALDRYAYGDRPLREEISQVVTGDDGKELGVVTRNLYGALVLNTARAMFIDIDFPQENAGATLANSFRQLFGTKTASAEQLLLEHIRAWSQRNRDLGLVVYRTAAGLRCLVTNEIFEPGDAAANEILGALESDRLYIRLCKAQGCFRARLTPKPWRCEMDTPPTRFPFQDVTEEALFRKWEQQYERVSGDFTTCRRVEQLGPQTVHPEVARIMELHDRTACANPGLKLA